MKDPTPRHPGDAIAIHETADAVGWDLPLFVERGLYYDEFEKRHKDRADRHRALFEMLEALWAKINKAQATGAADDDVLYYEYFRKINDKVTKAKPIALKCSLFIHPDYHAVWGLIERDDDLAI